MKSKKAILLLLFLIPLIFLKTGCFDVPKDLVAPKWDVNLNVPIVTKDYTLWDAIKKDTSKIKFYRDQNNQNLLYYSEVKNIDKITVGDNLNVESFTANTSLQIGDISISDPEPVEALLLPGDLGLESGQPFPLMNRQVFSKSFDQSQQFERVVAQTGTLVFLITNKFPSPIQIIVNHVTIKNVADNSIIADAELTGYILGNGDTGAKTFSLENKVINGLIKIEVTISSGGSGGNPVIYDNNSKLECSAHVQNLTMNQVTAKISENTFNIEDAYTIDDSTYIQSAVIDRGSMRIVANSNLDLNLSAVLKIHSLKNSSGTEFSQTINLGRNEKNKIVTIPSLAGYTLSDPGGGLTNQIKYSIEVTSPATSDFRTIYSSDNILAELEISDLYFRSITGKLKPTNLTVNETSISLDLGEMQDKLSISQVDLENPKIQLKLRKSTNIGMKFSGQLIGRNATQSAQLNIPETNIGDGETVITLNQTDVRNFIKSFTNKLPTTVSIKGKGQVNPAYSTGTVASTDSVYGTANLEFPLKFSLTGGSFTDSVAVDLSDNDRKEMEKVKGGTLKLEIQNGIGCDVSFSARLYNQANQFLMNLPPNHSPNDTLVHIQAATVNSQGKVTAASTNTITISLNQSDVEKIIQSKYLKPKVVFHTSGNTGQTVEFKTSDLFKIKAYGQLNYTVEEKK